MVNAEPARRAARVSNPVFARIFPRMSQAMEAGGVASRREPLLAGLTRSSTWAPAPGPASATILPPSTG